jgi:NTE family protein
MEQIKDTIEKPIEKIIEKIIEKPINKYENKKILIISGGGVRGAAILGALTALNEFNYLDTINTIACVSIGAIIGTLLIIGYKPVEIYNIFSKLDLSKLSIDWTKWTKIIESYGFDDGKKLEHILKKLLTFKKISEEITLIQLYEKTKKTLIITATCTNEKKVHYISHENYPNMPLIVALRMSSSIPFYFSPVIYEGKLFIDGGCMDNYPIHLFKDKINDVIGIFIKDIFNTVSSIENPEEYIGNVVQCLIEGVSVGSTKGFEECTIQINISDVGTMDLNLNESEKKALYLEGYNQAITQL